MAVTTDPEKIKAVDPVYKNNRGALNIADLQFRQSGKNSDIVDYDSGKEDEGEDYADNQEYADDFGSNANEDENEENAGFERSMYYGDQNNEGDDEDDEDDEGDDRSEDGQNNEYDEDQDDSEIVNNNAGTPSSAIKNKGSGFVAKFLLKDTLQDMFFAIFAGDIFISLPTLSVYSVISIFSSNPAFHQLSKWQVAVVLLIDLLLFFAMIMILALVLAFVCNGIPGLAVKAVSTFVPGLSFCKDLPSF